MRASTFYPEKQRGAALLMALLVVAILAMIASVIFFHQSMLLRDQLSIQRQQQIESDWHRIEGQVMQQLAVRLQQQYGWHFIDGKTQKIVISGQTFYINILDAQSKFNINQVILHPRLAVPLLQALVPSLGRRQAQTLAQNLHNWLQLGAATTDDYYQALPVPYRAAHMYMLDSSELALVKGFAVNNYKNVSAFSCLQPWVIALPKQIGLNVLDADPRLISALLGQSAPDQAAAVLACQKVAAGQSAAMLSCMQSHQQVLADFMSVDSRYLLLQARTMLNHHVWRQQALLTYINSTDHPKLQVVYEHSTQDSYE